MWLPVALSTFSLYSNFNIFHRTDLFDRSSYVFSCADLPNSDHYTSSCSMYCRSFSHSSSLPTSSRSVPSAGQFVPGSTLSEYLESMWESLSRSLWPLHPALCSSAIASPTTISSSATIASY